MTQRFGPRLPGLARARAGAYRLWHRPADSPAVVLSAIREHQARDSMGEAACLKWGWTSSVTRGRLEGRSEPLDIVVKQYRWRGLRAALAEWLRGSRARRALTGTLTLARTGILSPEPIAVVERRWLGVPVESFLVTRFAGQFESLTRFLLRGGAPSRTRVLARYLGDTVGTLHAAGIDHSDLKHSNILVGRGLELALLDLESLRPFRRRTWKRRIRSLGQLEVYAVHWYTGLPRTDRARFLRAYLRHQPQLRGRERELVEAVRNWVERRLRALRRKTLLRPEVEGIT